MGTAPAHLQTAQQQANQAEKKKKKSQSLGN